MSKFSSKKMKFRENFGKINEEMAGISTLATLNMTNLIFDMSNDPIGLSGGLNMFGFVGNDPVNLVDFYGFVEGLSFGHTRNQYNKLSSIEAGRILGGMAAAIPMMIAGLEGDALLDGIDFFNGGVTNQLAGIYKADKCLIKCMLKSKDTLLGLIGVAEWAIIGYLSSGSSILFEGWIMANKTLIPQVGTFYNFFNAFKKCNKKCLECEE